MGRYQEPTRHKGPRCSGEGITGRAVAHCEIVRERTARGGVTAIGDDPADRNVAPNAGGRFHVKIADLEIRVGTQRRGPCQ